MTIRLAKVLSGIVVTASLLLAFNASADTDPAEGVWQTEASEDTGGYLHVQVARCEDLLCGTIFKAFGQDDQESADYKHLGKLMITGMNIKGNGKYAKGKIWAPDKDKVYKSKMKLEGNKLSVSGCVAFICRSQVWTRVK